MQMGGGGSCNIKRSCGLMRGQCKTQTRHNNKQAKETNRTICVRQKQKKTKRHKLHKHKQKYSSMLKQTPVNKSQKNLQRHTHSRNKQVTTAKNAHTNTTQNYKENPTKAQNTTNHTTLFTHIQYIQQLKQRNTTKLKQNQHQDTNNTQPNTHK